DVQIEIVGKGDQTEGNNGPVGPVVINGIPREDETLTADASGITDADGVGDFSYQWLRDGTPITGATGETYRLTQADVGALITVVASYTDGKGTDEAVRSDPTDNIINVNDLPTGGVSIEGGAVEGETLTANTGSLADEDGLGPLSYQWLRDGVAITDATADEYQLTQDDVGAQISLKVTYTDLEGTPELVNSTSTSIVANINDLPFVTSSAVTTIDEDVAYNYTFTASDVDAGDVVTLSAETKPDWLNFDASTGVLSGTPTNGDVGDYSVVLRATDTSGAFEEQSFTVTVSNVNDAPFVTSSAVTSIDAGAAYSYTFTASDVDAGDVVTLSAETKPDWLSFDGSTGVLSGTPTNEDVGDFSVVLRATDASGAFEDQSFTVTVSNSPPISIDAVGLIINTEKNNTQYVSRSIDLLDGTFVVSWKSNLQDGSSYGAFAQRIDADGKKIGSEFLINSTTENEQGQANIIALADGGFVCVWASWLQDGSKFGIYAQRFGSEGEKIGGEFLVNSTTAGSQENVSACDLEDGGLVVVWQDDSSDGDGYGIFAQRFDASLNRVGVEFQVNTSIVGEQLAPRVTGTEGGGFFVTWRSNSSLSLNSDTAVTGQFFNSDAARVGGEKQIFYDPESGSEIRSPVATLSDGNIAITWTVVSGQESEVFVQIIGDDGSEITTPILINGAVSSYYSHSVIRSVEGGFVVAWQDSIGQPPMGYNIIVALYDNAGNAVGDPTVVNPQPVATGWMSDVGMLTGALKPLFVDLAINNEGKMIISWTGDGESSSEIFASTATIDLSVLLVAASNVNNTPVGAVVITGAAQEGQRLTADASGVSDEDGLGPLSYQWQRDGIDITQGTAEQYELTPEDVGAQISVTVSYTDLQGTLEAVNSDPTVPVVNADQGSTGPMMPLVIFGTDDDDILVGTSVAEWFYGLGGNDSISGSGGGDRLSGDAGNDILSGGASADTFVFALNDGNDEITDFELGVDSISLIGGQTLSAFTEVDTDAAGGVDSTMLDFGDGSSVLLLDVLGIQTADEFLL
ncbi:putative Ig domain-containing protein, partial [Flavimaricola sp.]